MSSGYSYKVGYYYKGRYWTAPDFVAAIESRDRLLQQERSWRSNDADKLNQMTDQLRDMEAQLIQSNAMAVRYAALFEQCRRLLRYDGIDKDRVRQAVDQIRFNVDEILAALESDPLN